MATILTVDNEDSILELLRFNLEKAKHQVLAASNGADALMLARLHIPDAIVLDIRMPDMDGYAVFKELRVDARTKMIPVLVLSGKASLDDRIYGLGLGVDDYVSKPFSPNEVVLRVASLVQRASGAKHHIRAGAFFVDKATFRCFLRGKPLNLTITEYKILTCLLECAGQTLDRAKLIGHVWGPQEEDPSRSLDTHMRRLRGKLGTHGNAIKTVRSKGYKVCLPVQSLG